MAPKKIIAVIGATGNQGGGLIRAILNDASEEFVPRALTRTPDSDKAKSLAELGAEVVAADLNDPKSIIEAYQGADAAYCVTFFWQHLSPEKELAHARTMAEAANEAGVQHVIWSTLEDTRKWVPLDDDRMPTLAGEYKVPHFDAKGEADDIFRQVGVPTTFLLTSFYWDNFIFFGSGPKRGPDGKLALTFPLDGAKLPGIAAEDIGKCALGIFKRGSEFIGKTVAICGERLTGSEMAEAMSEALGQEVVYNAVSPDLYRSFDFPGADDMGNMFQFKRDFNDYFCGVRDPAFARSLNPELQTFEQWLARNKDRIPLD